MTPDRQYEDLLLSILSSGNDRQDRTGTGTRSKFGCRLEYDISASVPLITTKKVAWKAALKELLWMISGNTNIRNLQSQNCHIWDEWADSNGDLGPIYGHQWRMRQNIDQLQNAIDMISHDPTSRRIIVDSWQLDDLQSMRLPPCHMMFQFYVDDGHLDIQTYQRSADMFLGVPFNLFEYAALDCITASVTGLKPGRLVWIGGDCHIYHNHFSQVRQQLNNEVKAFPQLSVKHHDSIDDFILSDFVLSDYHHAEQIKAPVAV